MKPELPPLEQDDETQSLRWHALNYRTAHTLHAEEMCQELERFVQEYATKAVLAVIDHLATEIPDLAYDLAIKYANGHVTDFNELAEFIRQGTTIGE